MSNSPRARHSVLIAALAVVCLLLLSEAVPGKGGLAHADVQVAPGTATAPLLTNPRTGSGTYTSVSPIVIGEGLEGDFPPMRDGTATIAAPPGWEFRAGPLDTSTSTLAAITSVEAVATASAIEITYSSIPARGIDIVRITGLFARPAGNEAGDGTASGIAANGTANIIGFAGRPAVRLTSTVGPGTFATPPVFSPDNLAQVVFNGGAADQLAQVLTEHGAVAAWAQDPGGAFVLYLVNGGFVNDAFKAAFPGGITRPTALTVVRD
ncbi:MAG: hypothetical protein O2822_00750 [Chloroflexi bacterium]|nr:hypothetical protein [Chloroflexota bacterium]